MQQNSDLGPEKHPMVDEGWRQMQAILDKEMPVRKKRRGLIWPFLFAGALLLGGSVWWTLDQAKPTGDPPSKQGTAAPSVSPSISSSVQNPHLQEVGSVDQRSQPGDLLAKEDNDEPSSKRQAAKSDQRTLPSEPSQPDRTSAGQNSENILLDQHPSDRSTQPIQNPPLNEHLGPAGLERPTAEQTLPTHQDHYPSRDFNVPATQPSQQALTQSPPSLSRTVADSSQLGSLQSDGSVITPGSKPTRGNDLAYNAVSSNALVDAKSTLNQLPVRWTPLSVARHDLNHGILDPTHMEDHQIDHDAPLSRFEVGIAAATISDVKWTNYSFDVGLDVAFVPKSSWKIGLGLYYWRMNARRDYFYSVPQTDMTDVRSNSLVLSGDPDEASIFEANVGQFPSTNISVVSEVSTERLHYLRIPLYLQLNTQQKWQPLVGMTGHLLLAEGRLGSTRLELQSASAPNPQDDLVRPFNLSIDAGLSYQILKNLHLQGTFSYGLRSHLNYRVADADFSNLHRYLRLHLRYAF